MSLDITQEPTYTTEDVKTFLKCSDRKVWSLAKEHNIGLPLGGAIGWRFTQADIDKLLTALRPAPEVQARRRRRRSA